MDTEALSELIRQHGKAIYGFCYKLAGNKADTDDLYQETFLKAMEMLHQLDASQNPKSFLISIAVRLRKNKLRKWAWRQRIVPTAELGEAVERVSGSDPETTPEDAVLSRELRRVIHAAADTLSDKLKIPLYMYYTADMSVEDIAAVLKIPAGTVKSRLFQARKALKKRLEVDSL